MESVAQNWAAVQERIARAAGAAGRDPAAIHVVAVTKTRTAAEVDAALAAGVALVGENRVQEAQAKRPRVSGAARWHLIGHLQRNKAARALELFDVIQSLDDPRLADALERRAAETGRTVEVLLQVNTAGAASQSGVSPEATPALAEHVAGLGHLQLRGLMTIAAFTDEVADVRRCFRDLRRLAAQVEARRLEGVEMRYLSMGMSGDFEIAIAEGSNMVRIGTAIFGARG
ncbi:MAG: YggS family pyridoxal phosphate-dependent enzyme [Gemmatimonadota bacterium]